MLALIVEVVLAAAVVLVVLVVLFEVAVDLGEARLVEEVAQLREVPDASLVDEGVVHPRAVLELEVDLAGEVA